MSDINRFECLSLGADLPPNMKTTKEGPGALRWPSSPSDVYCCVKRFAADPGLAQDSGYKRFTYQEVCKGLHALLLQEPLLVWPELFMRLYEDIPRVARPLKCYDVDRRKKLLQLAEIMVDLLPSETTRRTVQYLVHLTDLHAAPGPLAPLHWISARVPSHFDALEQLDLLESRPMVKLMPQMRLSAKLHRI